MPTRNESTAAASRHSWILDALRAVAAVALLAAAPSGADAAFDNTPASAQAAAMGGASLANQGDSAALFLNPAGGAGLPAPEAYLMYNQLYTGLSGVGTLGQGFAAFGVPTKLGMVGVGLSDFQAAGLLDQRTLGLTYARRWPGGIQFGVTGKYLYQNYLAGSDAVAADPVFRNGTARSAFALDLGGIAPVTDALHVGLALRNLNQPDMGLASSDTVPRQVQAGLSYDFKPQALRLTADYTYSAIQSGSLMERNVPGVGLEKAFVNDMVKFRVGLNVDQFSGGVGLQLGSLGVDYTFVLSRTLLANNAGSQLLGIRYRFGGFSAPAAKAP
ncbi:MAG: hypothetical protein ACHQ49_07520 [Elusimicrobiota bacterium]